MKYNNELQKLTIKQLKNLCKNENIEKIIKKSKIEVSNSMQSRSIFTTKIS